MGETNRALPVARHTPARPQRLDAVDFWRGFVLCTIFINHVPGNLFEKATYRNLGFSDSAEAFVFISGLSLALAYGRRFAAGGARTVIGSLGRRAAKLYGAHIALSLAGVAIFALGAALFNNADLMQMHGRDLVLDDPKAALIGLVSLGHQFGYFNILPLYILLVAAAPLMLWLAGFGRWTMLTASIALYTLARLTGLNVPTWPMRGTWFLDPFAWQLVMVLGIACGMWPIARPARPLLLAASAAVVFVSAFVASDGFGLSSGLFDAARESFDLDKTSLGLGRLLHFVCLAYLVAGLRLADLMRGAPWYEPLCLIGRNGLVTFLFLSLLAAVGQVLTQTFGHSASLDLAIVSSGLALIYGCARFVQHHDAASRSAAAPFGALRSTGRTTL